MDLTRHIRPVPDFPKPGILFRDITPLLADHAALAAAIAAMAEPWRAGTIDAVAAVEARGFLFAAPLALELGVGVIPVRKPGKLPADTIAHEYELEYGRDRLEMHRGVLAAGARVLVVDDVLATGGTAAACMRLVEAAGGTVAGAAFLVEIAPLGGRERLSPHRVESVIVY
ncbi:MAG: adenine phosphoribosyltransferase [Planctomycetota bacterium]|jgi:adenine phosphoribosyltransferase|nr:MAG: adenine phosphoribosyltransferase [Planctomycetota bacterium]